MREFGRAWAGGDEAKQAFIDALSIIPMGTKVGQWAAHLLATPGKELCTKLAILRDSDSDLPFESARDVPKWAAEHDPSIVRVFISHPTLEPAITPGNEHLVLGICLGRVRLERGVVDGGEPAARSSRCGLHRPAGSSSSSRAADRSHRGGGPRATGRPNWGSVSVSRPTPASGTARRSGGRGPGTSAPVPVPRSRGSRARGSRRQRPPGESGEDDVERFRLNSIPHACGQAGQPRRRRPARLVDLDAVLRALPPQPPRLRSPAAGVLISGGKAM